VNDTQPDYLATLVLTFYKGPERLREGFGGEFEELNTIELCREMKTLIGATELDSTTFRSDHVSNHLILKGVLGKDKTRLLQQIDDAITYFSNHPEFEHIHHDY
jgi:hypothetical protein